MLRYVALGLLQDGQPRHGYALMKKYRDRVGAEIATGNFYRELQRLVESGFARAADRSTESDPRRTPYVITDAGCEAFARWFADVAHAARGSLHDDDVSDRLAFLADVPFGEVRAMLDRLQDDLWIQAKVLDRSRDRALANQVQSTTDGFPVFGLIVARRIRHVAAEVAFLAELREAYDAWLVERQQAITPVRSTSAPGRDSPRPRPEPKKQRS